MRSACRFLCPPAFRHWPTTQKLQAGRLEHTTPRHAPAADLEGHLTFALKYEGLDLAVLKALFQALGPTPIEGIVRAQPTGCPAAVVPV